MWSRKIGNNFFEFLGVGILSLVCCYFWWGEWRDGKRLFREIKVKGLVMLNVRGIILIYFVFKRVSKKCYLINE